MLEITPQFVIPRAELRFRFDRSSGPGGQNVNKTNTKATMHWNIVASPSIPGDVRERFLAKYGGRVSQAGDVVLASDRHRDQRRNLDACLEQLRSMLLSVLRPPRARKATRPTAGSQRRRLEDKRSRSRTKEMRREPRD